MKEGPVKEGPVTATSPSRAPAAAAVQVAPVPRRSPGWHVVHLLGSMKLAVWLVLTLAALTWLGTIAQLEASIHDVQREYFESWFVVAELPVSLWNQPLFDGDGDGRGFVLRIPLPGAYPVLALLFVNLLVGGMLRLRWSARNAGILIIHVGIASLLVAGFVKLHFSYSGNMQLFETPKDGNRLQGRSYEAASFASFHDFELALLTDKGDTIEERVVPESALWPARDDGSVTLRGNGLPFTVQVHHFVDHSRALPKGPMVNTTMPVVDGAFLRKEVYARGEERKSDRETAGCYVRVFPHTAQGNAARIEGVLWGQTNQPYEERRLPFTFTVDGQRYGLDLRHVVYDLPFAIRLDRFVKEDHPGTMAPKEFRSFVSVIDDGQVQEAQIFMNNPVRRDGYVAYQAGWGPQPMGGPPWYTGLEISYNPSDIWPALACFVIAFGMLLHFTMKLVRFLGSSARKALQA